jgi:two-component system chemotaxis response regulator CheB
MRLIDAERVARDVIMIGASAGGIPAIEELLACLPGDLPAIVGIVNHRSAASSNWSNMLGRRSSLTVSEPLNGERLSNGHAYVAPADRHMRFHGGFIFLDRRAKQHSARPAIDPLSCAATGNAVVCVWCNPTRSTRGCPITRSNTIT